MRIILVLSCLVLLAQANRKNYDGYKLLQAMPETEEQLQMLYEWRHGYFELDFWSEPRKVNSPVDILVPPQMVSLIKRKIEAQGMKVETLNTDLKGQLDELWDRVDNRPPTEGYLDLDDYHPYDDIMVWMDQLRDECNAAGLTCTTYNAGNSYEGRELKVLTVGSGAAGQPAHWIDSTIHAREWLATATIMKIMDHMVHQYGVDPDATQMVDGYDWYLMPVMNPDGYIFTWSDDRLWRKNRTPNDGSPCLGTDLNRNFDFRHCMEGASSAPCADTYCGASGGSEPETQAVQAEALRLRDSLLSWTTMHSYGYMFMHPWGNTVNYNGLVCERADDHDDMYAVAQATAIAIQETDGTNTWDYGTSCEVIYATTGGTDDYVKGVHDIKYAFCPELRGNGFVVPPSQIHPSFQEFWNGIVAMAEAIDSIP